MTATAARRSLVTLAIALASVLGCTPVDRWPVFETSADPTVVDDRDAAPVELPATLRPRAGDDRVAPRLPDRGPVELSVEQATLLSLTRNRELSVEQRVPVIVGAFEEIERGRFDPELFAELSHARETATETARATEDQFSVEGRDTGGRIGLRQELPTGTTLEAVLEQQRAISNRTPEQQEARIGLSVTQSLLEGLGPSVQLASVRQAELDTVASLHELRGFTEALLAETEIAYWSYVRASLAIEIVERSLEVAQRQREAVEERIEVGLLPETEAAAARTEVARREQAMIDAQSALEDRRLRLLRLVGAGAPRLDRDVVATSDPRVDPEPLEDVASRVELALRSRPDLNEARLRLAQRRLETIVTRNGLLPRLELFVALGKSGFGDTFGGSVRDLDGDGFDLAAGVQLADFLGARADRARDRAARASRDQALAAVANLEELVRLDVRVAANQLERSRKQITASAATLALAERTAEAERERLEVGASTTLLVSQAERDLLESQIAATGAIIDYRIRRVELYLAEGSLLERRGIVVPGVDDVPR